MSTWNIDNTPERRERIATEIAKALVIGGGKDSAFQEPKWIASKATLVADALIAELDKGRSR